MVSAEGPLVGAILVFALVPLRKRMANTKFAPTWLDVFCWLF